jgi:hypothetical protein
VKATIDFDPVLFQRLKVEAARRGRTIKDLVAEGVRTVLGQTPLRAPDADTDNPPEWVGSLHRYAKNARGAHDMESIRSSIARGRSGERK